MESRRFLRVNSLKAASPDDPGVKRFNTMGDKADGWQTGAAGAGNSGDFVDLGGNESPAWQDYFFLAPNVRFTRTPDYEAKTRHPQRDQIAAEQSEPPVPPAQQASARPAAVPPSHAATSSPLLKSRNPVLDAVRSTAGNRGAVLQRPAGSAPTSVTPRHAGSYNFV